MADMKPILQGAHTYQYDEQTDDILYYPNFNKLNQSLFDPMNKGYIDSDRLCKLTTWTPNSKFKIDWATSCTLNTEPPDRIDLLFDSSPWIPYSNTKIYIVV